jgi:hypothetical protein
MDSNGVSTDADCDQHRLGNAIRMQNPTTVKTLLKAGLSE